MDKGWRNIFIFIVVLILVVWWIVISFENYPSSNEDYNSSYEEKVEDNVKDNFSTIDKLHWIHMPVTFSFVEADLSSNMECQDHQIKRVRQSFSEVETETGGSFLYRG